MKKFKMLVICLFMILCSVLIFCACNNETKGIADISLYKELGTTDDGFLYGMDKDENIVIIDYKGDKKNIVIPKEIIYKNKSYKTTKIYESTFQSNVDIVSVEIPNDVITIEKNVFSRCKNLEKVTLPKNIEEIKDHAFENCEKLKQIFLPKSLKKIDDDAFSKCDGIQLYFETDIERKEKFSEDKKITINCKDCGITKNGISYGIINDGKGIITSITLNNTIVFPSIINHKNVEIEINYVHKDALKNIKENSKIQNIIFADTISHIQKGFFDHCESLNYVKLPKNLTTINSHFFKNIFYSRIKNLWIPKSITNIHEYAFAYCNNLKVYFESDTLPENWSKNKSYVNKSFLNCKGYYIKDGVSYLIKENDEAIITNIDNNTKNIEFLSQIDNNNKKYNVSSLDGNFKSNNLETIVLPKSLKTLKTNTFINCKNLSKVELNSGINTIEKEAIKNCPKLKKIYIPNNVKSIEDGAFTYQTKIFAQCKKASDVFYNRLNINIFWNCKNCETYLSKENLEFYIDNNNAARVLSYSGIQEILELSEKLTYEKRNYFIYCIYRFDNESIKELKLNKTQKICKNAFKGCNNLQYIFLPKEVKYIEDNIVSCSTKIFISGKKENVDTSNWKNFSEDNYSIVWDCVDVGKFNNFSFAINSEKEVFITGYEGEYENNIHIVKIPSFIKYNKDKYYVKNVCAGAFLKKIFDFYIPKTITYIGRNAFHHKCNLFIENDKASAGMYCDWKQNSKIWNVSFIFDDGNYRCVVKNDKTALLLKHHNFQKNVCIPSIINYKNINYKVIGIESYCFEFQVDANEIEGEIVLEKIYIPKSILYIKNNAINVEYAKIYIEAADKPEGWDEEWCVAGHCNEVIWDYKNK